ncbi:hypothetical protein A4A49_56252, partial [Nicotiana attenuata]
IIVQDESQQTVGANIMTDKADAMAMQARRGRGFRGRKQFMQCEHCHMRNHAKENCYKLIGYPSDFDQRKKTGAGTHSYGQGKPDSWKRGSLVVVNHANVGSSSQAAEGGQHMKPADRGHYFTDEQYSQILSLLSKDSGECQANTTGKVISLMSKFDQKDKELFVDSGATHHITSSLELLENTKSIDRFIRDKVHLPTGEKANITHIGIAGLFEKEVIKNVLYVPNFRFNQLSVSKLTKAISCNVNFFPDFCVFQYL